MAGREAYRVLVIDDEQVVLDASARLLSAEGFEVLTALDAESGLQLVESNPPDLAVVDLKLPGMSGLEFMDKALLSVEGLRIILTTGISSADQAVAALRHGAFDFLPKPFSYEELMSPVLRASRDIEFSKREDECVSRAGGEGLLFLGKQAWAKPDTTGIVRLGASCTFQRNAGKMLEVVPPKINVELRQGGPLARVRCEDGHWHVVLTAVGGRVLKINHDLVTRPSLLNQDPWDTGWIADIQTAELYRDLPNLLARQ